MAWQDKIFEAKYTAPSGKEFIFHYDPKVTKETELKTGIFQFPDKDGAHVQHQGAGTKSFPLTCIFSGDDCMDQADAFEKSLHERDVAELQHPAYGIIKVIPTGNIKREDDLVNALNESRVTVTFTETLTAEESTGADAVSSDTINKTFEEFSESAAHDFAENISVDTVAEGLALQSVLSTQAQILNENLIPLVESDSFSLAKFKTIYGEIKTAITSYIGKLVSGFKKALSIGDDIIGEGLDIARYVLNLSKLPSEILVDMTEKVEGYSRLVTQIINQFQNDPFGINNVINAFESTNLVLSACAASIASGAAISIAEKTGSSDKTEVNRVPLLSASSNHSSTGGGENNGSTPGTPGEEPGDGQDGDTPGNPAYEPGSDETENGKTNISREESFQVIRAILAIFEMTKTFQDSKIKKNTVIDSNSNSYLLLNELVYSSIQLIMNASLSLPMRRIITLDQDRQVIELVCELYGSVDYLDKFIADNDLNADELEVIPMGREVLYSVKVA